MSGGVDSFVTLLLLKQQGYKVSGVNLWLWEENEAKELAEICRQLEVPLITYDGRTEFREKVVRSFVSEYGLGRTPSPCAVCNPMVKWKLLCQVADSLGIEKVATGHYVNIIRKNGRYYIGRGKDSRKDQSYFLWGLTPEQLSRALTPLGEYTKADVKKFALEAGYLNMADQKESMGVCFLQGKDYRDFLTGEMKTAAGMEEGEIVDTSGNVLGWHKGLLHYTVGQKRGMPLKEGEPLYVAEVDYKANRIVADVKASLYRKEWLVQEVNVIDENDLKAPDIQVKVRGLGLNPEGYASIELVEEDRFRVRVDSPAWAIAPGQSVVFYRDTLLIGGGIVV